MGMNEEYYVSLEVAKLLKEKGYNELCTGCYRNDKFMNINSFNDADMFGGDFYSAPTLYEAQKWLISRGIYIDISIYGKFEWSYTIYHFNDEYCINGDYIENNYTSYEKALNAGILEALKLI